MTSDSAKEFGGVALDETATAGIQDGIFKYTYRGVPMLKCPFDIALYTRLIWDLKPKTLLEFGSKFGGSALWFADILATFGLNDTILRSYDIRPVTAFKDPRIEFLEIDVSRPQDFLDAEALDALPRPILVVEDSSHQYAHLRTLLNFLHPHLRKGDYLVIEDGILTQLGMAERYEGGPLRAIREFLELHGSHYEIDRELCDAFGRNVTWNVEGYLKRTA